MGEIVKGSRVRLVNLLTSEGTKYHTSQYNRVGNVGNVTEIEGRWINVMWDNSTSSCYLLHNLELIEEKGREDPKDIYSIAQKALEADGIIVSRQVLKLIAYRVVFGELLFEVMQKEKLDLQTTGAIIAALNKAIVGE